MPIIRAARIGNENRFRVANIPPECQRAILKDGYAYTFWEGDRLENPELSQIKRGFVRVEMISNPIKEESTYRIVRAINDLTEVRNWYYKHDLADLWEQILKHSNTKIVPTQVH
jgi:hypothetical protein